MQTHRMSKKLPGFTLIEVMLGLFITVVVAAAGYVSFSNYYKTTVIDSELKLVKSVLERTRQKAIGNATGTAYSVKFLSTSYVVFPGTTYTANDANNISYPLTSTVLVSTTFPQDILTFNNFTGRAASGGTITVQAFGADKQLVINQLGIVEDII